MAFAVDYSSARPGGAALKAQGVTAAGRYLASDSRGITTSEYADLKAHGISVWGIYEGAAKGMLNGRAQGVVDAQAAVAHIKAVGLPQTLPVYFTTDFDAAAAQFPVIDEYLEGAASVISLARVGHYGGLAAIEHTMASKTASFWWQTYAWSSGKWASGTHLQQYLNGQWNDTVDFNRTMTTNYGQDTAGAIPVPISLGDDMKIFQATNGTIALIGETFGQTYSSTDFDEQANAAAWGPYVTGLTQDQITTLVNDANARGAAIAAKISAPAAGSGLSDADLARIAALIPTEFTAAK